MRKPLPLKTESLSDVSPSFVSPHHQSMPGPLFNFSAYLGAVMAGRKDMNPVLGSFLCWLGMFGPGVMLIFALLPFWGKFRNVAVYRKMMPGTAALLSPLLCISQISLSNSLPLSFSLLVISPILSRPPPLSTLSLSFSLSLSLTLSLSTPPPPPRSSL